MRNRCVFIVCRLAALETRALPPSLDSAPLKTRTLPENSELETKRANILLSNSSSFGNLPFSVELESRFAVILLSSSLISGEIPEQMGKHTEEGPA